MRNAGTKAWIVLLANLTAYEFICDEDQLLSRAFGRFRRRKPITALVLTAVTVAHLWEIFDALEITALDPFQIGLLSWARKLEQVATL